MADENGNILPEEELNAQGELLGLASFLQQQRGDEYSFGGSRYLNPEPITVPPKPILGAGEAQQQLRFPPTFLQDLGMQHEPSSETPFFLQQQSLEATKSDVVTNATSLPLSFFEQKVNQQQQWPLLVPQQQRRKPEEPEMLRHQNQDNNSLRMVSFSNDFMGGSNAIPSSLQQRFLLNAGWTMPQSTGQASSYAGLGPIDLYHQQQEHHRQREKHLYEQHQLHGELSKSMPLPIPLPPACITDTKIPMTDRSTVISKEKANQKARITRCKARGTPRDHTAKTAFFIIRENVQHGEGLLCSHPECQKKGIRFVYCKVCQTPVAKINFSTRHKHINGIGHHVTSGGMHGADQEGQAEDDSLTTNSYHLEQPMKEDHSDDAPDVDKVPVAEKEKKMAASPLSSRSNKTTNSINSGFLPHPPPSLEYPAKKIAKMVDGRGAEEKSLHGDSCGNEQSELGTPLDGRRLALQPQGQGSYEGRLIPSNNDRLLPDRHLLQENDVAEREEQNPPQVEVSHSKEKNPISRVNRTEQVWIELLNRRPSTEDETGMESWVSDVIQSTNPSTTTSTTTTTSRITSNDEIVYNDQQSHFGGGYVHRNSEHGS